MKREVQNTSKGITLIALVITIIVLLILAGVAINMAIDSDGLFGKANEAVKGWNTAVEEEQTTIENLLELADKYTPVEKVEGDPSYWETDGAGTLTAYKGPEVENMVIPNYVDGEKIEKIGDNLFAQKTYIKSLTISEGIKTIGNIAFGDCAGLTGELIIPDSVETIGIAAFVGCTGLTGTLVIPDSVETIGRGAFAYCTGFTGDLIIPNSIISIEDNSFTYCGFNGSLIISDSVITIGNEAFSYCAFDGELKLGNSVTSIGEFAFTQWSDGEGLDGLFTGDLVIPSSLTEIGARAFWCSGFLNEKLIIPDSVITIGDSAFESCGFAEIDMGSGVTEIGERAFEQCMALKKELILPDSIKLIKSRAFGMCIEINSITVPSSVETVEEEAFSRVPRLYYTGTLEGAPWGALKLNDEE